MCDIWFWLLWQQICQIVNAGTDTASCWLVLPWTYLILTSCPHGKGWPRMGPGISGAWQQAWYWKRRHSWELHPDLQAERLGLAWALKLQSPFPSDTSSNKTIHPNPSQTVWLMRTKHPNIWLPFSFTLLHVTRRFDGSALRLSNYYSSEVYMSIMPTWNIYSLSILCY